MLIQYKMQLSENISLKLFNSFGIEFKAKYFSNFTSAAALGELTADKSFISSNRLLVLGGGSNILFTKDFDGLVLKNELKGIELVSENEEYFYVKASAGENWHRFVLHCLDNNYAG